MSLCGRLQGLVTSAQRCQSPCKVCVCFCLFVLDETFEEETQPKDFVCLWTLMFLSVITVFVQSNASVPPAWKLDKTIFQQVSSAAAAAAAASFLKTANHHRLVERH